MGKFERGSLPLPGANGRHPSPPGRQKEGTRRNELEADGTSQPRLPGDGRRDPSLPRPPATLGGQVPRGALTEVKHDGHERPTRHGDQANAGPGPEAPAAHPHAGGATSGRRPHPGAQERGDPTASSDDAVAVSRSQRSGEVPSGDQRARLAVGDRGVLGDARPLLRTLPQPLPRSLGAAESASTPIVSVRGDARYLGRGSVGPPAVRERKPLGNRNGHARVTAVPRRAAAVEGELRANPKAAAATRVAKGGLAR
jgi:hypothetical protein